MKYEALKSYLAGRQQSRLQMTFEEVAKVAETRLPASAYRHPAWWANDETGHVQAKAWLEAGFRTEDVDIAAGRVTFVRVVPPAQWLREQFQATKEAEPGVREMQHTFESVAGQKLEQHPLVGWMKGTFTIEPGWDLTKSALDEDELAEWEANLDRKADLIEKGLRGRK